ncbi:ABC transporter I family member 20 [Tanacetum coccineum]
MVGVVNEQNDTNTPIVVINKLKFTYLGIDGQPPLGSVPLIEDLSLSLTGGERCLLVGSNGAGKTTILKILGGKHMVEPHMVRVLGRSVFHDTSLSSSGDLANLSGEILAELNIDTSLPVPLHCDNSFAMQIAENPVFHERTKHFEIELFFLREKVASGIVKTVKVKSADNNADIFKKCLSVVDHNRCCKKLGLYDMFRVGLRGNIKNDKPKPYGLNGTLWKVVELIWRTEDAISTAIKGGLISIFIIILYEYKDKGGNESDAKPSFSDISKTKACMMAKAQPSDASSKAKVQACGSKAKLQTSRSKAKLQTSPKTLIVKSFVPITNCILGLANATTCDTILSKTFGLKIPPTMACAEEKKGNRKISKGS